MDSKIKNRVKHYIKKNTYLHTYHSCFKNTEPFVTAFLFSKHSTAISIFETRTNRLRTYATGSSLPVTGTSTSPERRSQRRIEFAKQASHRRRQPWRLATTTSLALRKRRRRSHDEQHRSLVTATASSIRCCPMAGGRVRDEGASEKNACWLRAMNALSVEWTATAGKECNAK